MPTSLTLRVFVAEDEPRSAGVVSWREVWGWAAIHLDVIGVTHRLRRKGGGFAHSLAGAALDEIEADAIEAGVVELFVEGEVSHLNDASLRLTADKHFGLLEQHASGAQTWSLRVPIAGAQIDQDEASA